MQKLSLFVGGFPLQCSIEWKLYCMLLMLQGNRVLCLLKEYQPRFVVRSNGGGELVMECIRQ